jgi:hypothetical protein
MPCVARSGLICRKEFCSVPFISGAGLHYMYRLKEYSVDRKVLKRGTG